MTNQLKLLRAFAILFAIFAATLGYQNCSQMNFDHIGGSPSQPSNTSLQSAGGDGYGYDGKLDGQFLAYDLSKPCGENSKIERANHVIEISGGRPKLLVENCLKIPARDLGESEIIFSEIQKSAFAFAGQTFERQRPDIPKQAPYLTAICRSLEKADDKLYRGTDVLIRRTPGVLNAQVEILSALGVPGGAYDTPTSDVMEVSSQMKGSLETLRSGDQNVVLDFDRNLLTMKAKIKTSNLEASLNLNCEVTRSSVNLLAFSEDMFRKPLLGPGGSISTQTMQSGVLAPNNLPAAHLIADTSTTQRMVLAYWYVDVAPNDTKVRTFSVYLKHAGANFTEVHLGYGGAPDVNNEIHRSKIDVTWSDSGVPTITKTAGRLENYGFSPEANGWYRFWVSVSNNGLGNYRAVPRVLPGGYDPTGTGDIYIWGLQLVEGSDPLPYQGMFANFPIF